MKSINLSSVNIKRPYTVFLSLALVSIFLVLYSCKPDETKVCKHSVLVIVTHPDDETLISGTLAKLNAQGCDITIVFVTSGDDGPDRTGQGLYGASLADVRESEAERSLKQIGISNQALFLGFPDSFVSEHKDELSIQLLNIFQEYEPEVVISFGPDGVTNSMDHISTGSVADQVFDTTNTGKLLLHMAISQSANKIYPIPAPVANHLIDLKVRVSEYKRVRIKSNKAHLTQFGFGNRLFWRLFVLRYPFEEFIIFRNHDGEEILRDCF
jgi:LmbE family N-acetylglucosaminyl deacetylase